MAVEKLGADGVIVTGEDDIRRFQLITVRAAMRLELAGMTHSGGSVIARWKKHLGLKGNRQKVYDQFCAMHGFDSGAPKGGR